MGKAMTTTEKLQAMKQPIVEMCIGEKTCSKVDERPESMTFVDGIPSPLCYCKTYAFPAAKWRIGNCNMADHLEIEVKKDGKKVNPLKASKRGHK